MNTLELLDHSRDTGETVVVNLADLVKTLVGSCDQGMDVADNYSPWWVPNIVGDKVCDSQMGYLIDSLLTYGFVVPINIVYSFCDGEAVAYGNYSTGNGNHRLTAALFCGFEEIPVIVSNGYLNFEASSSDENYIWEQISELHNEYRPYLSEIRKTCKVVIEEMKLDNPNERY